MSVDTLVAISGVVVTLIGAIVGYLAWQYPKRPSGTEFSTPSSPSPKAPAEEQSGAGIPEGIQFGGKVVLIPGFQQLLFTHSGWIEDEMLRGKQYRWLQRGDIIGRYHMDLPKIDKSYLRPFMGSARQSVDVRSPVSGLILHSHFNDFITWPAPDQMQNKAPRAPLSVLIPDDEPPPENSAYMYGPALRFLYDHKAPLFRKSKYWSLAPMTEDQVSRLTQAQKAAQCLIVDAMPGFRDYFEEARKRDPALRPYLRHLI